MTRFKPDDRVKVVKIDESCSARVGDLGTIQNVDEKGPWLYYVKMDVAPRNTRNTNHEWFREGELEAADAPKVKRGKAKTTSDD